MSGKIREGLGVKMRVRTLSAIAAVTIVASSSPIVATQSIAAPSSSPSIQIRSNGTDISAQASDTDHLLQLDVASWKKFDPSTLSDKAGGFHVFGVDSGNSKISSRIIVGIGSMTPAGRIPSWILTRDTLQLAWGIGNVPGARWTLYIDGKIFTSGTYPNSSIKIPSYDSTTSHEITITPSTGDSLVAQIPKYGRQWDGGNKLEVARSIEATANHTSTSKISPNAAGATVTSLSYRAFIPAARVGVNIIPCKLNIFSAAMRTAKTFGGDGRSFANNYNDKWHQSRAEIALTVHFSSRNAWPSRGFSQYTGTSHAYDAKGKLVGQENAGTTTYSGNGYWGDLRDHPGRAVGYLKISGANPLCIGAPAIDGIVNYNLTSDGGIQMHIQADRAPDHEVLYQYTASGQTDSGSLYRQSLNSFYWLAGPPVYPQTSEYRTRPPGLEE